MTIFKIAKTGDDALTTANKDLAFDLDYPCLNVIRSITLWVTTDGSGDGSNSFSHDLGYYPMYKTYVKTASGGYALLEASALEGSAIATAYSTTSKISVIIDSGSANTQYTFEVKVFGNSADDSVGTTNNNVSGRMRVARVGHDAKTATDVRELVFQSGVYVLKYDPTKSGSFVKLVTAGDLHVEKIYHNLGYVPYVFVKEKDDGGSTTSKMLPVFQSSYGAYYEIFTDRTEITLDNVMGTTDITFNVKYFLYLDKLA